MSDMFEGLWEGITLHAPRILAALVILVVGWLIATVIAKGLRRLLSSETVSRRLPVWLRPESGVEGPAGIISRLVFFFLMLFVLVAAFQALGLTLITEPLNGFLNEVFLYAPKVLAALALLVVALVIATVAKKLLGAVLVNLGVDHRLQSAEDAAVERPVSRSLAETVYWLILLLFLPAILGALGVDGMLAPVEAMVAKFVGFLPNLLAAAVIFLVGWFVARIVQRVVTGLLAAAGADAFASRLGLGNSLGPKGLSGLVGVVVHALILIPVVVASLNALQLQAVTDPASRMLDAMLGAVPHLFAAALILLISHLVGRMVAGIVAGLLNGVGFDRLPATMGMNWSSDETRTTPSLWAGRLVHLGIMLFATAEAARQLGFAAVSTLTSQFLEFGGRIVLGLVIMSIGMLLANAAGRTIRATGTPQSAFWALLGRTAVLVLTGAMALREMGFANEIVNLAFGLLFGAVAIAAALAFGLGGRETAAGLLSQWRENRGNNNDQR